LLFAFSTSCIRWQKTAEWIIGKMLFLLLRFLFF
jgi:hypothetical protein